MEKTINRLNTSPFKALINLIHSLRGKSGCPWDKQQTPTSIARYLIEEAHELAETVETGDIEALRLEL
ncbi:MAG: MazG nucleotide pyrophosphohydrolase domain-containing protein, partial [Thermodesulfobacteriota bacterium]|nr:MazG nucleotide pyrophosphohydrolase domain-containing protein [Thermodesulfobacteriota bacterium]